MNCTQVVCFTLVPLLPELHEMPHYMYVHSLSNYLIRATILGAVATTVNKTNKACSLGSLYLACCPDELSVPNYRAVLFTSTSYLGSESSSKLLLLRPQHWTALSMEARKIFFFLCIPQTSLHGALLVFFLSCPGYRVTFAPTMDGKGSGQHQCPLVSTMPHNVSTEL